MTGTLPTANVGAAGSAGEVPFNDGSGTYSTDPANFLYDPTGSVGPLGTPETLYVGDQTNNINPGSLALWDLSGTYLQMTTSGGAFVFGNDVDITGSLTVSGTITGVVAPAASNTLTSQTATGTITSVASAVGGLYRVGGYLKIRSASVDVLNFQLIFHDETNTVQTVNLTSTGGATSFGTSGIFYFNDLTIWVQSGTTITLRTAFQTSGGLISFDAAAHITQL